MQRIIVLLGVCVSLVVTGVARGAESEQDGNLTLRVELIDEGPMATNYVEPSAADRLDCALRNERFDLQEILTIGEKIWQIVKDNQPTVNFTSHSASAIPAAAVCAFNLTGWSIPYSRTYKLSYENLWGSSVVDFTFKVIFSYGGNFNGRGAYLANVTVHPVHVNASWGQNFDASVVIANAINVGSSDSPVAGMEVAIDWTVKNVFNNIKSRRIYFVDGHGNLTEL